MLDVILNRPAHFLILCLAQSAFAGLAECQSIARPTIRDSAGVRIVEHSTIRNLPIAFDVSATPRLHLGGLRNDPREEFASRHQYLLAVRMSDGRIVVNDPTSLKIFDASGKILQVVGREGQGPGEFTQVTNLCVAPGDTIIAISGGGRASLFDRSGKFVRVFTPVKRGWLEGEPCFSDGSLLFVEGFVANPASRLAPADAYLYDRTSTARRVRTDGTPVSTIGTFPLAPFTVAESPFEFAPWADSVYFGNGESTELRLYSSAGRLVRIVRWKDSLTPVTTEIPSSARGGARAGGTTTAQTRPPVPQPKFVPTFKSIKVDPLGRVWMLDHELVAGPRGWTVFDATGALLGRVYVPALSKRVTLQRIGRDEVVLLWHDDVDGAAHLSFHAIKSVTRQ